MSTWDLNRMDYLQLFGDGSDGDVTISVNTSLVRDMYYLNLTVDTNVTLNPNGFRIHVADTLTGIGTGVIACNGRPATAPAASNTAGTAGFGSAGGLGQATTGGSGTSLAVNTRIGGLGGAGGAGTSGAGGAAGAGVVPTAAQGGVENLRVADIARELARPDGVQYNGGTGGGGGGGSGATRVGGNAGSGGGIVFVAARRLAAPSGSFTISANGANGANAPGGNRGGGGGGGGGAVIVISTDNPTDLNISLQALGGTGGTGGGGGGVDGTQGGAGNVYNLVV